MTYFQRLRRLATPAVLAAWALVVGQVWAGMSLVDRYEVTLITNDYEYGLANPLPSTLADQVLLGGLFNAAIVRNANADGLRDAFTNAAARCNGGGVAKLIWFSGHAGMSGSEYILVGQPSKEEWERTKNAKPSDQIVLFSELLAELAKSKCQFVIGVDAEAGKVEVLPSNVSVIWAAPAGHLGSDGKAGGHLTRAFASVFAAKHIWYPNELTEALQNAVGSVFLQMPSKDRETDKVLEGLNARMPWIQQSLGVTRIGFPPSKLVDEILQQLMPPMVSK